MTFFSKNTSPINLRTISSVSSFSWNHFIHQKIEKVLSAIGEGNSFRKKRLSPDDCWQMALLSMADCIRISCKRKKRRQIWDIPAADAFGLRIHGDCSSMTNCRYQLFFFSLSFRLLFGSKNSRTLRFSFHFPYPSGRIDRPWRPPLQIFRTGRWISWMRLFRPKWTAFPRIFLWFLFGLNRNAFDDKVGRGLRPTFHSTQCHLRRLCVWRLIWKIENFSTKWPG